MYGKILYDKNKSAMMFPSWAEYGKKCQTQYGQQWNTNFKEKNTIKDAKDYWTGYKKKYYKKQEQDCGMIQANQLETTNGKQCQVVIKSKCYDNPKEECNSMQKSVKKITHEKDSDRGTDH